VSTISLTEHRAWRITVTSIISGSTALLLLPLLTVAACDGATRVLPIVLASMTAFLIGTQGVRTDCGWNAAMRCAGPTSADSGTLVMHTVGILVGAAVTAALLGGVSNLLPAPLWLVAGAFMLFGIFRLFRPSTMAPGGWKVRRQWEAWGPRPYMLVFGFCVGLGFVTTMASPVYIALMLYGTTVGLTTGLLVFAWFAFGRMLTTWVIAVGDAHHGANVTRFADRVQSATQKVGILEAVAAGATGIALLFST